MAGPARFIPAIYAMMREKRAEIERAREQKRYESLSLKDKVREKIGWKKPPKKGS